MTQLGNSCTFLIYIIFSVPLHRYTINIVRSDDKFSVSGRTSIKAIRNEKTYCEIARFVHISAWFFPRIPALHPYSGLRENLFQKDFLAQIMEKPDSNQRPFSTTAKDGGSVGNAGAIHRPTTILGQAPSQHFTPAAVARTSRPSCDGVHAVEGNVEADTRSSRLERVDPVTSRWIGIRKRWVVKYAG